MNSPEIEHLIHLMSRLPGLGPRSARRAALTLLKKREALLEPLAKAMSDAAAAIRTCPDCGNLDTQVPCAICTDEMRDGGILCVVADVADLWALERSGAFRGRYHVLGGTLSALDGIGPDDLNLPSLIERAANPSLREVILALGATVTGQTTAHYITDRLSRPDLQISGLAHGVPVGGELDFLDDGTLSAAISARRPV
ncbi:MAG: recombination protein RecR [Alphaproteobacteria bacterium]|jgi:recombination protein RecR|nr:recombination protein RecR [Alphaproteobacteria bacterium]